MMKPTDSQPFYDKVLEVTTRLEKENPGKTVVLNAANLEVIIISDDDKEIAAKVKEVNDLWGVVPLFCGGPYIHNEVTFHHMSGLCITTS